jgi:hypothetical protein
LEDQVIRILRDFGTVPGAASEYDDSTTNYTKALTLKELRPQGRGRQRALSQENLKFDNDSEDGTQGNEMTAGVLRGNFGDMGADDDEGGNNHTQYNGKPGYSQMDGDSNASVTASENSD